MKATRKLHDLGQSIWLDNITRDLLDSGTLQRYVDELSVTGLTSNPTIFDQAIKKSAAYDPAIRENLQEDGAKSFVGSWNELLGVIASKSPVLGKAS
jgi:transaldolase